MVRNLQKAKRASPDPPKSACANSHSNRLAAPHLSPQAQLVVARPQRRHGLTTRAVALPSTWSSPPHRVLAQIHTPPAQGHLYEGGLTPSHHLGTNTSRLKAHDGPQDDTFALLVLPNVFMSAVPTRVPAGTQPCSRALLRHVSQALARVRADLGSVDPIGPHTLVVAVLGLPRQRNRTGSERADGVPRQRRWQVAGLVLAHELPRAYRAHNGESHALSGATSAPPAVSVGDVWCSGTTLCGVQLMWVAESWRGRGVAYAMVESARRHVCYGHCIDAALVAFSEPTELGAQFARRYSGRADFLVY